MRTDRTCLALTLLILTVISAAAPEVARAQGALAYVTGGPVLIRGLGIRDFAWRAGGGAEILDGPVGIGVSADFVHFLGVTKTYDGGRGGASSPPFSTGTLSAHASFYFGGTVIPRRVRPYISGGLTYLFGNEAIPTLDVAAGVDWWTTRRAGFRFELRQQVPSLLSVRAGVVFR